MFYTMQEGHPFAQNPLSAIVSPRPIAWISSRDEDGIDNLAPYSFFNLTAFTPAQVMFTSVGNKPDQVAGKDTLHNIKEKGVFCINIAEAKSVEALNLTAGNFSKTENEFDLAGIQKAECELIQCSRVLDAPASLECELNQIIKLAGEANYMVLGNILAVHIRPDCIVGDRFEVKTFQPLSRLGYNDYSIVKETFELERPTVK